MALISSIPPAAPDIELYVVIQILLMIETFIDAARATYFFYGRADAGTISICPVSTVKTDIVYWH